MEVVRIAMYKPLPSGKGIRDEAFGLYGWKHLVEILVSLT